MPFEQSKSAGTQRKSVGKVKNRERIIIIEDARSIALNISPPKIKRLLINKRPAQKRAYCGQGCRPNVRSRNANAAARSMHPRTLTIILMRRQQGGG